MTYAKSFLVVATAPLILFACGKAPEPQGSNGSSSRPNAAVAQTEASSLPSFDAIAKQAGTLRAAGLVFEVPEDWVEEPARSRMRLAQYRLPGEAGPAQLAVFAFGPGQGGATQDNIDRWVSQFADSNEPTKPVESEVSSFEKDGLKFWLVKAVGTYSPDMMGHSSPDQTPQTSQALFGLIVEGGPQGTVFVKTTGPQPTVEAHTPALEAFARSARKAD